VNSHTEWRIDEEREAVEGVRFLALMLEQAVGDPYFWKWFVVAMHNALHAGFVLALKSTWPVRLLPKTTMKKVLKDQHEAGFDFRVYEEKIAPFLELYKRVQDDKHMGQLTISKALPVDSTSDKSIEWLNENRNMFIHTRSMSYIRDISTYPQRLLDALSVLEFLVHQSGNVHLYDDQDAQDIASNLLRIRGLLELMDASMRGADGESQPAE
jgi:hypothetical protein